MRRKTETIPLLQHTGAYSFAFQLRKNWWQLDDSQLAFFDLNTPTIYGDRRRETDVNIRLANRFIARCYVQGVHESVAKQETYLLARLAPFMRAHASQKFLPDASGTYLTGGRRKTRIEAAGELASLLEQSQGETMTLADFSAKTKAYLSRMGTVQQGLDYKRHKWKILHPTVIILSMDYPEQGADQAIARWHKLTKRRHFDEDERFALDALAYEARAAVRRCYADMWRAAIEQLRERNLLNDTEYRLHLLMHCELPVRYISHEDWVSAFHGHIFGLHPASDLLLCTGPGRRLIKDVAMAGEPNGSFERFLHGLYLALYQQHEDHLEYLASRRKSPQNESSAGSLEEREARQHQVKKKRKPPSTD